MESGWCFVPYPVCRFQIHIIACCLANVVSNKPIYESNVAIKKHFRWNIFLCVILKIYLFSSSPDKEGKVLLSRLFLQGIRPVKYRLIFRSRRHPHRSYSAKAFSPKAPSKARLSSPKLQTNARRPRRAPLRPEASGCHKKMPFTGRIPASNVINSIESAQWSKPVTH